MAMLDEFQDVTSPDIRENITFFSSQPIQCPVCTTDVYPETMLSGRGRLDAGELRDDLYRNYMVSADYGAMFPFLYGVMTCPKCYYSTFTKDFTLMYKKNKEALSLQKIKSEGEHMLSLLYKTPPDFKKKRDLLTTFAAYLLAVETYSKIRENDSPSIRMAICSLRAAWIARCLEDHGYGDTATYLKDMLYRKACSLYKISIEKDVKGIEILSNIGSVGPDVEKNYGYDGVNYLIAFFTFQYENFDDSKKRVETLQSIRQNLSRLFGFGKSSRGKPSILLSLARNLFDKIEEELSDFI